jgi:hypothetical protein
MSLSQSDLARLRRMIQEDRDELCQDELPPVTAYDNGTLNYYAANYAVTDSNGVEPGEDDWTPTYDLNATAADIWEEKASAKWEQFDVAQMGTSISRRQKFDNAMAQSRHFRSRARARSVPLREAV